MCVCLSFVILSCVHNLESRPSQLAKLSRSEFDPELFSQNAYDKFVVAFVTSAVFDILLQNETIFDIGNG